MLHGGGEEGKCASMQALGDNPVWLVMSEWSAALFGRLDFAPPPTTTTPRWPCLALPPLHHRSMCAPPWWPCAARPPCVQTEEAMPGTCTRMLLSGPSRAALHAGSGIRRGYSVGGGASSPRRRGCGFGVRGEGLSICPLVRLHHHPCPQGEVVRPPSVRCVRQAADPIRGVVDVTTCVAESDEHGCPTHAFQHLCVLRQEPREEAPSKVSVIEKAHPSP